MSFTNKSLTGLLIVLAPILLFFIIFMRLDRGEQPKEVDVIIVPEGALFERIKQWCLWQYRNTEDCNTEVHSLAIKNILRLVVRSPRRWIFHYYFYMVDMKKRS